jgi:hypothetical protein
MGRWSANYAVLKDGKGPTLKAASVVRTYSMANLTLYSDRRTLKN